MRLPTPPCPVCGKVCRSYVDGPNGTWACSLNCLHVRPGRGDCEHCHARGMVVNLGEGHGRVCKSCWKWSADGLPTRNPGFARLVHTAMLPGGAVLAGSGHLWAAALGGGVLGLYAGWVYDRGGVSR